MDTPPIITTDAVPDQNDISHLPIILSKFNDAFLPGIAIPFSEREAVMAGALTESALSFTVADESNLDIFCIQHDA